jgi:hypothetical protein
VCVVHSFSCTSFQLHAPVANYSKNRSIRSCARLPRPRSHETATLYGGELKSMTYSAQLYCRMPCMAINLSLCFCHERKVGERRVIEFLVSFLLVYFHNHEPSVQKILLFSCHVINLIFYLNNQLKNSIYSYKNLRVLSHFLVKHFFAKS